MLGRRLAHYEIHERLGAGGMGEVYRAHDNRLGRDVALKLLPDEASQDPALRQRLEQEARSVASLHHPNIVTLYSVEEDQGHLFLTMELVRGPQLSQLLTVDGFDLSQFLKLALPMTDAIGAAHEVGLIHRDLKPSNMLLDEKGRLKILDFGLAKQLQASNPIEGATIQMSITNAGTILGTCSYMSPEQAQGGDVDTRSDVFSLGIILYEMACGRRPFVGENPISIISSILKDEPPTVQDCNASVPPALSQIIMRCLEKDPQARWDSARELHAALLSLKQRLDSGELSTAVVRSAGGRKHPLRRWPVVLPALALVALAAWKLLSSPQPATPARVPTAVKHNVVVVFPFENLGPAADSYFADGVTDEIVSRLTAVRGIGVISRTSAVRYDRAGKSLAEIAEDLHVDYVLEGTIRWDRSATNENRVRITPQLVRIEDQVSVWSESYDRQLQDVFQLQSEIARQVVHNIDASLLPGETVEPAGVHTENLEAYDFYLQAKQLMQWRMGPAERELRRAAALLDQALELDPQFAGAHASLSRVSSAMYFRDYDRSETRRALAASAADRALELDPELAEAHLAKGLYYYRMDRDYDRALQQLEFARGLAPGDAEILSWMGTLWKRQGQFERAADILQLAQQMDPYNPTVPGELAIVYRSQGEYAKALEAIERVITLDPSFASKLSRAVLLELWKGDLTPRRQLLRESGPGHEWQWVNLYEKERQFDAALAVLDSMQADPDRSPNVVVRVALERAQLYWIRGEIDKQRQATVAILPLLETGMVQGPQAHEFLGFAYAYLGKNEEALQQAELAIESTPLSRDYLSATDRMYRVAQIHAVLGEVSQAVAWLDRVLSYDRSLTPHELQLECMWDPIRDHPEFIALMKRLQRPS